jgi:hypothetical protein
MKTSIFIKLLISLLVVGVFSNAMADDSDKTGKERCESVMSAQGYGGYQVLIDDMCSEVKTRAQGSCMVQMIGLDSSYAKYSILVKNMCLPIQSRGQLKCAEAMLSKGYVEYPILIHNMCLKFVSLEQGKCAADEIINNGNDKYDILVENACKNK